MIKETPLVSVIMPVYNAEEFLCEAIESVLAQTYSHWELILVDDGSTDNCGVICEEFAQRDARIQVVHQENCGASEARNTGLSIAQGEWVQFFDDDDIMLPQCIETMLNHSHQVDMVVCGYAEFPQEQVRRCVDSVKEYIFPEDVEVDFLKLRRNGFFNPQWNKLYRKNCLGVRFDKTKDGAEDVFFSLSYLKYCKRIRVIPNILFRYRLIANRASLGNKFIMGFPEISEQMWYGFQEAFQGSSAVMNVISEDVSASLIRWTKMLTRYPNLPKEQKLLLIEMYLGEALTCKHKMKLGRMHWKRRALWWAILWGKPQLIYWAACLNQ